MDVLSIGKDRSSKNWNLREIDRACRFSGLNIGLATVSRLLEGHVFSVFRRLYSAEHNLAMVRPQARCQLTRVVWKSQYTLVASRIKHCLASSRGAIYHHFDLRSSTDHHTSPPLPHYQVPHKKKFPHVCAYHRHWYHRRDRRGWSATWTLLPIV